MRDSERVIENMRWGLLPRWRGHGGKRGPLVNAAPLEAVPGTPLLRDSFKKQRCLVLADGCFAWRELKQPEKAFQCEELGRYFQHAVEKRRVEKTMEFARGDRRDGPGARKAVRRLARTNRAGLAAAPDTTSRTANGAFPAGRLSKPRRQSRRSSWRNRSTPFAMPRAGRSGFPRRIRRSIALVMKPVSTMTWGTLLTRATGTKSPSRL